MWVVHDLDPRSMADICNLRGVWVRGVAFAQQIRSACCCIGAVREVGGQEVVKNPMEPLTDLSVWSVSRDGSGHRPTLGLLLKSGPKRYHSVGKE